MCLMSNLTGKCRAHAAPRGQIALRTTLQLRCPAGTVIFLSRAVN